MGLGHLIGTPLLRAYMHGFFMDNRLYNKARSISEPFAYDEYRKQKIQQKLEEQMATRITAPKKLPKVNKVCAHSVLSRLIGVSLVLWVYVRAHKKRAADAR